MADTVYDGRSSRRSNAPCGHFRKEMVRITRANEIILSGSPIEYFVHQDYQNGDSRVTGTCKWGVAGLYNESGTLPLWADPDVQVKSVSEDGYTITLENSLTWVVGDLVSVYYYARYAGPADHQSAAQVGDSLSTETLDAAVQKLNDCPPLDFEAAGLTFDMQLCTSTTLPAAGSTTTVAKWAAVQVGTWQTTHLPFYVTSIFLAWDGDTISADLAGHSAGFNVLVTVDGGTERGFAVADYQHVTLPVGVDYDQGTFINLGLVECESDFRVRVTLGAPAGFAPSAFRTVVSGWHL